MAKQRRQARKAAPVTVSASNWEFDWHWRSIGAVVYFVILIFDFVAMPMYREITYNKLTVPQMVKIAQSMEEPSAQVETLKILKEDRKWTPLTNDMVHIAFGAILGVAALPSNRRRRRQGAGRVGFYNDDAYGVDDCEDDIVEDFADDPIEEEVSPTRRKKPAPDPEESLE